MAWLYFGAAWTLFVASLGYLWGASNEWYKNKPLVRELVDAYEEQDLLLEQLYEMRAAGAEVLGAGHPSRTRSSHLSVVK
tara:strand:+ start:2035 stop:2274 length:240 start_codon:yes stop_codon:yes gene_type:complete